MTWLFRSLAVCLLAAPAVRAQTAPASAPSTRPALSAKELLERVGRATDWTAHAAISLSGLTEVIRIDEAGQDETHNSSWSVELFQSGRDHLRINKNNDDGSGTLTILITPRFRLFWTDESVQYTESREEIERCVGLDRAFAVWGWFLDGLITDASLTKAQYFSLADAAADAYRPRVVGTDVLDGVDAVIVEANRGPAVLRVWVAPERGYNFVKYTFEHPAIDSVAPYALRLEVSDVKLHPLPSGRWVINTATRREHSTTTTEKGTKTSSNQITMWRTRIDPAPDFVKLDPWNTAWIEDGLRTTLMPQSRSGPSRRYVWKAGGPVPDPRPDDAIAPSP